MKSKDKDSIEKLKEIKEEFDESFNSILEKIHEGEDGEDIVRSIERAANRTHLDLSKLIYQMEYPEVPLEEVEAFVERNKDKPESFFRSIVCLVLQLQKSRRLSLAT